MDLKKETTSKKPLCFKEVRGFFILVINCGCWRIITQFINYIALIDFGSVKIPDSNQQ
jgi:hypothetical protein